MKKKVVIFGTGDFAQVAYVYLSRDSPYEVTAFTVDQAYLQTPSLLGVDVVPFENLEKTHPPSDFAMFAAVGYRRVNRARAEVYQRCKNKGYELITYIHSRSAQWGEVTLGDNCFIYDLTAIQPFVTFGNNVIMQSNSTVGHHTTIGDNCFIGSHASLGGRVHMEENCFVGLNATVRDHLRIARNTVLGAGALIMKDTRENGVYVAQPAELSRVPSYRLPNL